jgi:hypothetical protein
MKQQQDSRPFFFNGKFFHRINQLPRIEKTCSIFFQQSVAYLSKEQLILLSTSAYEYHKKYEKPFEIINPPAHISHQVVLNCFHSLLSLFNDSEQIEINTENKSAFLFLSNQFDNPYLENICLKVSVFSPQYFFFSSERFAQIPQQTFSSLFDFTLYINNKPFPCSSVFASCLSNTILKSKSNRRRN